MAIRWEKFTVKSQQAMQQAQARAAELGNPEIQPVHLLAGADRGPRRRHSRGAREDRCAHERLESNLHQHRGETASRGRARPRSPASARRSTRRWSRRSAKPRTSKTSTSPPSTCCSASRTPRATRRAMRWSPLGATHDAILQGAHRRARIAARHRPESRRQIPGARKIRQGSHRTGPPRQARPRHRPR